MRMMCRIKKSTLVSTTTWDYLAMSLMLVLRAEGPVTRPAKESTERGWVSCVEEGLLGDQPSQAHERYDGSSSASRQKVVCRMGDVLERSE